MHACIYWQAESRQKGGKADMKGMFFGTGTAADVTEPAKMSARDMTESFIVCMITLFSPFFKRKKLPLNN